MIIGQKNGKIDIGYKVFNQPLGMCRNQETLYIGTKNKIYEFSKQMKLIDILNDENVFDTNYVKQQEEFSCDTNIHVIKSCQDELYFIDETSSCLCKKESSNSFKTIWKPQFISAIKSIDNCQLNGFCMKEGQPKYVTCLAETDETVPDTKSRFQDGLLIDIKSNEVLLSGLAMPHSPLWHKEKLYFLESEKGTLNYYDFGAKKSFQIAKVAGFTQGLDIVGNLAFIGVSKLSKCEFFSGSKTEKQSKGSCGLWIVNIKTGELVSFVEFEEEVDTLFSLTIMPHNTFDLVGCDYKQNQCCDKKPIILQETMNHEAV